MATSWRDLLPQILEREGLDVSSVSAVSPSDEGAAAPNGPNGPNSNVPASVVAGLQRLRSMRCPVDANKQAWPCAVRDALALSDRWAGQALALGWSISDLFGATLAKDADPSLEGLAVWLAGRKLLALTEGWAVASDAQGNRFYFHRPNVEGMRPMWALNG